MVALTAQARVTAASQVQKRSDSRLRSSSTAASAEGRAIIGIASGTMQGSALITPSAEIGLAKLSHLPRKNTEDHGSACHLMIP
jgi:hypothetical protein